MTYNKSTSIQIILEIQDSKVTPKTSKYVEQVRYFRIFFSSLEDN